jgi:GNAT superfamily N-acetyltransferase
LSASGPERARFDAPDVYALVVAQQEELTGRDGRGDIGPARHAAMFELPDGVFLAVRDGGRPVACGGVCRFDETRAELKRMYVVPEARGRGLGQLLLETGEGQQESLGLYASAGYEPIPCYGVYAGQAISRCFEKNLP